MAVADAEQAELWAENERLKDVDETWAAESGAEPRPPHRLPLRAVAGPRGEARCDGRPVAAAHGQELVVDIREQLGMRYQPAVVHQWPDAA